MIRYLEIRDQVGASGERVFLRAGRRLSRGGHVKEQRRKRTIYYRDEGISKLDRVG
jgi:hypothetical protein